MGRNLFLFPNACHGRRTLISFTLNRVIFQGTRFYCERRRRKGDGTKTDIFEERANASQDEYFRKKTRSQLQALRDLFKRKEDKTKKKEDDKASDGDKKPE